MTSSEATPAPLTLKGRPPKLSLASGQVDWQAALAYLTELDPGQVAHAQGVAVAVSRAQATEPASLNGDGADPRALLLLALDQMLDPSSNQKGWRVDISNSEHLQQGDTELYALLYILLGALQEAGFQLPAR